MASDQLASLHSGLGALWIRQVQVLLFCRLLLCFFKMCRGARYYLRQAKAVIFFSSLYHDVTPRLRGIGDLVHFQLWGSQVWLRIVILPHIFKL